MTISYRVPLEELFDTPMETVKYKGKLFAEIDSSGVVISFDYKYDYSADVDDFIKQLKDINDLNDYED